MHILSFTTSCLILGCVIAAVGLADPTSHHLHNDKGNLPFAIGLSPAETDQGSRHMMGMSDSEDSSSGYTKTYSISTPSISHSVLTCPTPTNSLPFCKIGVGIRASTVAGIDTGALNESLRLCSHNGLSITIPHTTWGVGHFHVSLLLASSLQEFFVPTVGAQVGNTFQSDAIQWNVDAFYDRGIDGVWMVASFVYNSPTLRSDVMYSINITVSESAFSCRFAEPPKVLIHVRLSEPVSSIPDEVATVMDVAVGVSVVSVVPSVIVRAGMVSTLTQMLYCFEFEPEEEVGFVNNPFGWAIGRSELQYHRGSVATALIATWILLGCISCILVAVRVCGNVKKWGDACGTLRLPSLPLIPLLLLNEVCVSSAVSMLFYGGSDSTDIVLSLSMLIILCGYMGMYVFQTVVSGRYITVELVPVPSTKAGCVSRIIRYIVQPTHDVVLLPSHNEGWLRRNYYFIAERRWATFGALEVVAGTLVNMLEGIPITTANRKLCIARPACVMVITALLLMLLIWKVPNAVRMQQWCSLVVMTGMMLTACLATANAVSPSSNLELSTSYIGMIVVGISMILGIIDTLVLVITYVPIICELLSLNPRGLNSTIERSKRHRRVVQQQGALQVPMLAAVGAAVGGNPPNLPPNLPLQAAPIVDQPPPQPQPREDPPEAPRRRRPRRARRGDSPSEAEIMHQILGELEELDRQEAQKKKGR